MPDSKTSSSASALVALKVFPILHHWDKGDAGRLVKQGRCLMATGLPWEMIAAHERQAKRNHDQTIQRLAERGGLSACEAIAVLEDREYCDLDIGEAHGRLIRMMEAWNDR